mmetsp:Transcript_51979/g.72106  ORF Transcript_51979/g.72106 Transcript_51979/m.72106 type:complete len:110 (-) Transcript_51979:188-517(-)
MARLRPIPASRSRLAALGQAMPGSAPNGRCNYVLGSRQATQMSSRSALGAALGEPLLHCGHSRYHLSLLVFQALKQVIAFLGNGRMLFSEGSHLLLQCFDVVLAALQAM